MFPDLANLEQAAIGFTLVVFRVAALMLSAPFFGSARLPRRFKTLVAIVIAASMAPSVIDRVPMPLSLGQVVLGMVGELVFGLVLGQAVGLVFIAAQWAGEMVGQQVGFNISEVLDPQFGGGGSLIGDLYFMLATAVFLIIGGHRQLILGIHASFTALPPLSIAFSPDLFDFLLGFLGAATQLALRLAAPVFVTMLVVDVALGCISKTMPQLNVMSAGMAIRGVLGLIVMAIGIGAVTGVLAESIGDHVAALDALFGR